MKSGARKQVDGHTGKLLGAYVPRSFLKAIAKWVAGHPERDKSVFLREAVREKLLRDGIPFSEK